MSREVADLISEHIKRRPEARAQDIYKLLYQGVFGVGHILSDHAWDVLVEEAGRINIDDHTEDPLFESVTIDGSMVRVNLRQYIKQGGKLDALFTAMKKSSEYSGSADVFNEYWGQFRSLVAEGAVSFSLAEIQRLDELIAAEGVKPRHHTEPYRVAYYPAYRVVTLKILLAEAGSVGSVKNHLT